MLNLTKQEKIVIIFLISSFLLGLGIIAYQKSHLNLYLEVKNSDLPINRPEKININEAGIEDLMRLKGVGSALAKRIVDYRSQEGSFHSIEDIKNVKGIGEVLFEHIKDDISVE